MRLLRPRNRVNLEHRSHDVKGKKMGFVVLILVMIDAHFHPNTGKLIMIIRISDRKSTGAQPQLIFELYHESTTQIKKILTYNTTILCTT